jgi:hypothetical protein
MSEIFALIMLGMTVTVAVAARNIQVANRKPKPPEPPEPVRLSRDAWAAARKHDCGLPGWRDWQKWMFK